MRIPSLDQCIELLDETKMPDHIRRHSLLVYRVAAFLTKCLNKEGAALDSGLIHAAALLHDITKARSLETGELHSETGAGFLNERGYPEVGSIVRQHVRLEAYDYSAGPEPAEIVNYADKRVIHDKVVHLKERKVYLLDRYGTTPAAEQRVQELWVNTEKLEEKLFSYLAFSPEQVALLFDNP